MSLEEVLITLYDDYLSLRAYYLDKGDYQKLEPLREQFLRTRDYLIRNYYYE